MNKTFRIVWYLQPWEIDDFERQINQLIKSSYMISDNTDIMLDVTMNTSIVDWQNSEMPLLYFHNKCIALRDRAALHFKVEFDINESTEGIQGVLDKRRSIQYKQQDYIIWLDSDVHFTVNLLPYMVECVKAIPAPDFILSPQIIKYWDSSWDILTNEKYKNELPTHRDYFDMYKLDFECRDNEVSIAQNPYMPKFGGGWFNLFTNSVFEKMPLPIELGSYGPDDTYIMNCSLVKSIPQFILVGQVVSETGKLYESNYIKPLLSVTSSFKSKISEQDFRKLIESFINNNQSI